MNIMLKAMQALDLHDNVQDMMEAGEFRVMDLTFGQNIFPEPYATRFDAQKDADRRNSHLKAPGAFVIKITPLVG